MTAFDGLTWQEAMRQGHGALRESESLHEDSNASEGRSNLGRAVRPPRYLERVGTSGCPRHRAAAVPGAHRSDHPNHRHRSHRAGPRLEQSYRFGFARLGPVLVVSILVGLATLLAAVATTVTLPYGALVGVLLYLDLRARKERLDLDTLKANLQASTA